MRYVVMRYAYENPKENGSRRSGFDLAGPDKQKCGPLNVSRTPFFSRLSGGALVLSKRALHALALARATRTNVCADPAT